MAGSDERSVIAFDFEAIHGGNFALEIDHNAVAEAVDALLDAMSFSQKLNELRGRQLDPIEGLYHAGGDASLGIAPWKMVDGPRGARIDKATAFPVAIARAASFDVDLERRVGLAIGLEVAAKGGNVLLAPTINLLRHPGWGRAQETYSEDTFHMGAMAVSFVSGVQNHVLSSPKHFALNNLENKRFELSADIDERSLRELYLPHFERCVVEAGAASIMTAYNKVNGTYCSDHAQLIDDILREDWGFRGFVESDWILGTRSTGAAIAAGMDIEMPTPICFTDEKVEEALEAGEIDEAMLTRNARHTVYQKVAWQLTEDAVAGKPKPPPDVVECAEHIALAQEAAEKSMVLLKNDDEVLPIDRAGAPRIAVVGDLAVKANLGDRGSSMVVSSTVIKPLQGLLAAQGAATIEHFASDADLSTLADFDVTLVVAGLTFLDEGEFIPMEQAEAEKAGFARGGDRAELDLPEAQKALITNAAKASQRTVVVLQGGSAILVRDWVDQIDALLMSWYGGREFGHALARIVFGELSPSGRLPVSFPRSMDQLMPWDVSALAVPHDLLHGYRWLDHHGHDPEYPFGFGMSYTTFEYSDLRVEPLSEGFECSLRVRNTGERAAAAVPQLYMSVQDGAVFRVKKYLVGFARVELAPGETVRVVYSVTDRQLSHFDAHRGDWQLEDARYVFRAGCSSADLPLSMATTRDRGRWV
ncbi:MAG: glycoside hydrolase family 3 C-terminal domain-containing protein [Pseudomonadota bacterium]